MSTSRRAAVAAAAVAGAGVVSALTLAVGTWTGGERTPSAVAVELAGVASSDDLSFIAPPPAAATGLRGSVRDGVLRLESADGTIRLALPEGSYSLTNVAGTRRETVRGLIGHDRVDVTIESSDRG